MKREYLSREEKKRKILLEIKKGKLKTKKLLKITKLGKQENSAQPADRTKAVQVWCLGYIYIYIYQNLESGGHHSIYPVSENK